MGALLSKARGTAATPDQTDSEPELDADFETEIESGEDDDGPLAAILRKIKANKLPAIGVGLTVLVGLTVQFSGLFASSPREVAVDALAAPPASLAGTQNLAVHYASFAGDASAKQFRVSFGLAHQPFVLVLGVQHPGGLRVSLDNAPKDALRAIVVGSTTTRMQIEGVPPDAKAYVVRTQDLYTTGVRTEPDSAAVPPTCDAQAAKGALPIHKLEREVERLLRGRVASFVSVEKASAASVPGVALSDALRAGLSREAMRLCERQQVEQRLQRITRAFHGMMEAQRVRQTADKIALHPSIDDRTIGKRTKVVKVVAIDSGEASEHDYFRRYIDYGAYVANQDRRRAPVTVDVDTGRPTFLVLTSVEPVTWRIRLKERTSLTGVHIGSPETSTIVDLPSTVPLFIESGRGGAPRRYPTVRAQDERARQRLVLALHDRFPDANLEIDFHQRVSTVAVILRGQDEIRSRN
jgi:hypothetical protein